MFLSVNFYWILQNVVSNSVIVLKYFYIAWQFTWKSKEQISFILLLEETKSRAYLFYYVYTATTAINQDDTTSDNSSDDVPASAILSNTANSK